MAIFTFIAVLEFQVLLHVLGHMGTGAEMVLPVLPEGGVHALLTVRAFEVNVFVRTGDEPPSILGALFGTLPRDIPPVGAAGEAEGGLAGAALLGVQSHLQADQAEVPVFVQVLLVQQVRSPVQQHLRVFEFLHLFNYRFDRSIWTLS